VQALIKALKADVPSGSVFFVSDGNAYSWFEVINIIASLLDKNPCYIYFPKGILWIMAIFAEAMANISRRPIMFSRDKLKEILQHTWVCDISNSIENLGYRPNYSLNIGMEETIHWYKAQGWL
ncbi:MAG: NAD(P)-dependent oxidoreductase, partial [Deltaproteobacteria bacterium]|nr:NAD(P)-dependent oxidoreductase [Deltaproteobacteria bacterium]